VNLKNARRNNKDYCSESEFEVFGKEFTLYTGHKELTVLHVQIQFNSLDEKCRQAEYQSDNSEFVH
jgi:uncharacterized protein YacL (UPF0231 family)